MRQGSLLQQTERPSVVSPLVDLLFNMMITMFLFLMIYMAVVLPRKDLKLRILDVPLPTAGLHQDYHANVGVRFGSGRYLFMLADRGESHALTSSETGLTAPESAQRFDRQGVANVKIDADNGWMRATRIYPDGMPAGGSGTLGLPVVVVDTKARVKAPSGRIERWGEVALFFYEEHNEPAPEDAVRVTAYLAVRKRLVVPVVPEEVPFDVSDHPLRARPPAPAVGIMGRRMEVAVSIVGGLEPYEIALDDETAPAWLQVVDNNSGRIGGTPPAAGEWKVRVKVKDAQTPIDDWRAAQQQRDNRGQPYTVVDVRLRVNAPLSAAELVLPRFGRIDEPVRGWVWSTGGAGPLLLKALTLPNGLGLLSDGQIVGTPTEVGVHEVVVQVTDTHPDAGAPVEARVTSWRVVPPRPPPRVLGGVKR